MDHSINLKVASARTEGKDLFQQKKNQQNFEAKKIPEMSKVKKCCPRQNTVTKPDLGLKVQSTAYLV
jgi:hypothetical protein